MLAQPLLIECLCERAAAPESIPERNRIMNETIIKTLESLELRDHQRHANMVVIPLFCALDHSPEYLTLGQAISQNGLLVTEVDAHGSVPELKAVNGTDKPILLLDGEELAGAKQNRILNTSILMRKKSEMIIPVSCTEQGRWSYTSDSFKESLATAPPSLRRGKMKSVSARLTIEENFASDQAEVWESVRECSDRAHVRSHTGAMRDVFEAKNADISPYLHAFSPQPGQKGLLVCISGKPVGLDYISFPSAFEALYPKLIRSYAVEALLSEKEELANGLELKAQEFVRQAQACGETRYKSRGHGWDHRLHSPAVVGSALTYREGVIHMAFFREEPNIERQPQMQRASMRRRFRME